MAVVNQLWRAPFEDLIYHLGIGTGSSWITEELCALSSRSGGTIVLKLGRSSVFTLWQVLCFWLAATLKCV